jgi:hypothetical protein
MAELLLVVAMAYVAWRLIDGARGGSRLPWRLLIAGCLAVLVLSYLADVELPAPSDLHRPTTEPEEVQP